MILVALGGYGVALRIGILPVESGSGLLRGVVDGLILVGVARIVGYGSILLLIFCVFVFFVHFVPVLFIANDFAFVSFNQIRQLFRAGVTMESSVEYFKLVAYAPNGLKYPFVRKALELFAQTLDVNVNGARVAKIVKAPYLIKQLIASENAIVV